MPVVYDARGVHAEVQRGPDPGTVVEGMVHDGLIGHGMHVEGRVRAEDSSAHQIRGHAEGSLAVGAGVEEGQVVPKNRDCRGAPAQFAVVILLSKGKEYRYS